MDRGLARFELPSRNLKRMYRLKKLLLHFELVSFLGSGSFGSVILCRFGGYCLASSRRRNGAKCNGSSFVAAKVVEIREHYGNVNDYLRETLHSEFFRHDNVARCYSYWTEEFRLGRDTKKFFVIIMEYCERGSLRDVIKQGLLRLDDASMWIMFRGILLGLEYIHGKELIHRDLKPVSAALETPAGKRSDHKRKSAKTRRFWKDD